MFCYTGIVRVGQDVLTLQAENAALRHEVATLREQIAQVQAHRAAAHAPIAELVRDGEGAHD